MIRTNRKCTCCEQRYLVIVRNTTVCTLCDMAANWEGIKVK